MDVCFLRPRRRYLNLYKLVELEISLNNLALLSLRVKHEEEADQMIERSRNQYAKTYKSEGCTWEIK